jgi:sarcosine oxidase subunit alpha
VLGSLGAGGLLNRWFEQWRQLGWNDLAVFITDMSAHWSVLSVAGPRTGEVLAKLRDGDDVPPAMTCLETGIAGIDGRIITASPLDVAEVEIHVPASAAAILCTHLKAAGADAELAPIGLEARNLAEIEAGGLPLHTAYGSRWSVIDFEPVQVLEAKQEDFIGKRMALKIAANGKTRPQLVRLEPENEDLVVPKGSLLVGSKGDGKGAQPVGYVVAGGIGPKTGHALAIGFLESGRSAVSIFVDGKIHDARVVTGASASEKAEATEEVLEHA